MEFLKLDALKNLGATKAFLGSKLFPTTSLPSYITGPKELGLTTRS